MPINDRRPLLDRSFLDRKTVRQRDRQPSFLNRTVARATTG